MINVRIENQDARMRPKITVIGVGGAGGNAVNNMINSKLEGCEFLVCNTDAQALESSVAPQKIQLGAGVTRGLGAGANPEIGQMAAEETLQDVMVHLEGSNMAFVTAGMGGGTGTGAAPVIARAAREQGILTVGVVTKPFTFEGSHRMRLAEAGIEEMQKYVDTLIIIPNQNLFRIANEKTTFADAFCLADEVLQSGVRGVTDLMVNPGMINLDFSDIRSVMAEMGKAMMGTGEVEGERRALEAAEAAISNPLLDDVSLKGARGVLINITGGADMTLFEVDEAANRIREEVDEDANIIFGSTLDENMNGRMRVSIVATGIDAPAVSRSAPVFSNGAVNTTGSYAQPQRPQRVQHHNTPPSLSNLDSVQSADVRTSSYVTPAEKSSLSAFGVGGFNGSSTGGNDGFMPASIVPTTAQPAYQPTANAEQVVTAEATRTAPTMASGRIGDNLSMQNTTSTQEVGQYSTHDYTSAAVARKVEETETSVTTTHTKPVHRNPLPTKRSIPPVAQPQAQRHGDAFIPPRPVDPKTTSVSMGMVADEMTEPTAEMVAPKKAVEKVEKKAPSLFERITGQKKQAEAPVEKTITKNGLSVELGGKKDEEELDIPAFLRRQAN